MNKRTNAMRSLSAVLLLLIVASSLAQFQQGSSGRRTHVRSGAGNFPSGPGSVGLPKANDNLSRGCLCLAVNQLCDARGSIPQGATRINLAATRVINEDPTNPCPVHEVVCCYLGSGGGNPGTVRPLPSGGKQICGQNQQLFPGTPGTAEADFGEYPWVTAIVGPNNEFISSGALINPGWVLTVAHRLKNNTFLPVSVRLGDYNLNTATDKKGFSLQTIQAAKIIYHRRFDARNLKNDVALIKLAQPAILDPKTFPHINTICLPAKFQTFSGKRCYVSGWGATSKAAYSGILQEVDLPIVESVDCQARLRKTDLGSRFILDTNSFICAGGEPGKDTCDGDGGAPLVCDDLIDGQKVQTVVGLVAWGIDCARDNVPAVYVNVRNFIDFIDNTISQN